MGRVGLVRKLFVGSLAARFRVYTLVVMAPLALLGGMLLYQYWVEMPREALDRALEVAEEGGHETDDFLARTGKVLELLAHLPEVQSLQSEQAGRALAGLEERFPEYQGLFLADAQGRAIAGYPPQRVGTAMGDRPYFQEALTTGQMVVSPVLTSRRRGGPIVIVAYPVLGDDGLPLGIIAADLDLDYVSVSLSRAQLGPDYRLAVFDGQGQLVLLKAPEGETADRSQCTRCHATPMPAGDMPSRAWVGEGRFHGLVITSLGWHVVVNAPASAVLGAAQTRALLVLGLVLFIMAISVSVATVLGRRMARPIAQLAEAARRFGAGEVVDPLVVTSRDEVGDLIDCFNQTMEEIGEGRRRLEEKHAQLSTLHALDRAISSILSLPVLVEVLADQVQAVVGVEGVAVYLQQGDEELALAASKGVAFRLVAGETAPDLKWMARRTLLAHISRGTETQLEALNGGEGHGQKTWCLAAPLVSKDKQLGAILFFTGQVQGFSPERVVFLSTVALQVSAGVENATLYEAEKGRAAQLEALTQALREHGERLQKAQEGIVETLNLSLQAKDPYTKGHADRVALLSRRIAQRLGLPKERREILVRAARLHDIGKIAIPEYLLNKEGPLTPAERADFQLHPERSAELLSHLPDLGQVLPAIRGHHERYDGRGYPDGLAGEEIPLEARIIALADSYDALTTNRPYRRALSHGEALEVLRANSGTQWDPQVVQAALDSFLEEGELD